jgi:hypothetical protein
MGLDMPHGGNVAIVIRLAMPPKAKVLGHDGIVPEPYSVIRRKVGTVN